MIPIIDRVVDQKILEKTVARFRDKNIILPTFAEQRDPGLIPGKIKDKLKGIGLWDLHPLNLFRITWKNEPREKGGLFGGVVGGVKRLQHLLGIRPGLGNPLLAGLAGGDERLEGLIDQSTSFP